GAFRPYKSGDSRMPALSLRSLVAGLALSLGLVGPLPSLWAQKPPLVPDDVVFETGIEYANPDDQHLKLNLARPKKGDGPFAAIVCIHGGGFRAGKREGYDSQCIRL